MPDSAVRTLEKKLEEQEKQAMMQQLKKETMVSSWTQLLSAPERAEINHGAGALRDHEIPTWRAEFNSA